MEVKKTKKASLKGNNLLYFLGGLNVVLLLAVALFSYKKEEVIPPKEEAPEIVELTEAVLVEIPEPETPPPPPPPDNEPPPPPPPVIPTEIVETPEKVEAPEIKDQEIQTPPDLNPTPSSGTVKPKVDLSKFKKMADKKTDRVSEPVTVNRVAEMAVYPGCEKHKGDKRQLIACFGNELRNDILRYLDTEYPDTDKNQLAVQLEFHVTTDGYITNIVPKRGDDIFKPQAKEALERVADYLKRKGKKIEPAKMADGSKATLVFNNAVVLQNPG